MKTTMDQFAKSVVYSHHQERKKEKKPFDSVRWNPILAFCQKKIVVPRKKTGKM